MSTIFTKIVEGTIPSYKIAENEMFYAFLDINPFSKGHTLVIPKLEVDYVFDLSDEVYQQLMLFSKKIALAMNLALECHRVGVLVQGTEVPHAHIHLIPFYTPSGREIFGKDKIVMEAPEFVEVAKKIAMKYQSLGQ